MDIEKLATAALKKSISMTDVLSDFVNDGDKEPSWDGNIYIYEDKSKKKNGIKKIPVQVKGEVRKTIPPKKAPKYKVSSVDLDNWLRDGGVMLFVVLLSASGEDSVIYCCGLTPVKIRHLQKFSNRKKWINVPLNKFPTENNGKVSVLVNFYDHMKKQTSFATAPLYTTEELAKEGILDSISLSVTTYGKKGDITPEEALLSEDVYLYANIKGSSVPQPLLEIPMDLHIGKTIEGPVCSDGKQFYSTYKLVRYNGGLDALLGKSITLKLFDNKTQGKLNYKLSGGLKDFIRDTECILAIAKTGKLSINGGEFAFTDLEGIDVEQLSTRLRYCQDVQKMLDLLGVETDLDTGHLTDQDEINIRNFTNAVVYGKPINFPGCTDDLIYGRFKIGNLEICIWANKTGNGYQLQSFFSDHKIVLFENSDADNKHPYPISHYALLKKNDFLEVSNINFEKIAEDIVENDTSPAVTTQLILFMLEMIKAYDEQEQKDERLLSLAEEYCSWLESLPDGESETMKLNRLQLVKRRRSLEPDELEILNDLRKSGHDLAVRCGANLLLGKSESAQDCFDEMNQEEKERFIDYPICNLGHISYGKMEDEN